MDWKDFLKLDRRKSISIVILFFLLLFVIIFTNFSLIKCEYIFPDYSEYKPPQWGGDFYGGAFTEEDIMHWIKELCCGIINLVISVIITYLIICMIFYFYDKFKVRKK